ncbi:MAG: Gfo/Idh/MocA family oxidoreductase [Chloroflexota bacterium]|nr:Gfo/Idh/MocA family oxidoreductase [Chloroflexota bacterium]
MHDEAIQLGVIGTGLAVERLHWPALKRLTNDYTVTAFANHTRSKAEHFAEYAGLSMDDYAADYHDLLARSDVDAVLISLPIPMNYPVTKAALEVGKHVICEKPAGIDDAEARKFIELVDSYPNLIVLITENCFYQDTARLARSLLDRGALGRVHLASWRTVSQLVPREGQFSSTPWRHDPGYEGGPHLDAGVHHTAIIRLLCGDVSHVSGVSQDANTTHGGPSDLSLNLRFVSGAVGNYTASYPELAVPKEPNDFRLYGTEGVMSFRYRELSVHRPDEPAATYSTGQVDGGHYNAFVNFAEAVRLGEPVVGTVAQTHRNMQIVLDGLQSAADGEVRAIDPYPSELLATALPLWRPAQADPLFDDPGYVTIERAEA